MESTGAKPTLINVSSDDAFEIDNTTVSRVLDKVTGSRFLGVSAGANARCVVNGFARVSSWSALNHIDHIP